MDTENSTPSFFLDPEDIKFIVATGADLDVDMYVDENPIAS